MTFSKDSKGWLMNVVNLFSLQIEYDQRSKYYTFNQEATKADCFLQKGAAYETQIYRVYGYY